MTKCSIEHCNREAKTKGFCGRHYQSYWKYGDPLHVEKNGRSKEIKNKPLPYEDTHEMVDGIEHKLCRECNEWFPMNEDNFYKKKGRDGFDSYCKTCSKNRSLGIFYKNHDKRIKQNREYYNENKKECLDQQREYRKENWELKRDYHKSWTRKNKDKSKASQEKRRMHKSHEIYKEEWDSCLDYFEHSCAYCGISEEESLKVHGQVLHKEHVDHEGKNDLSNNIPACRSCNSQKYTFSLENWYNEDNENFDIDKLNKINKWLDEDHKLYIKPQKTKRKYTKKAEKFI